jgi:hypothetical protein
MTKRLTCTQAQVRRIIRAAEREGYDITAIKPDGTLIVCKEAKLETESLESIREVVL